MAEYGHFKSQLFKKLHMNRQGRDPFFAADYMRRAHEMIVYHMSKVVSGDPRCFQDNNVLIVFRHGKRAADSVFHRNCPGFFRILVSIGPQTDYITLSGVNAGLDFLER